MKNSFIRRLVGKNGFIMCTLHKFKICKTSKKYQLASMLNQQL